jgi:hypothetical protein
MADVAAIAWRIFRRRTGYRLYHLLALVIALIAVIGLLAVPFWWLGEQGDGVVGVGGFVVASVLYLCSVTIVLAVSAVAVGRRVIRRFFTA